jgi:hypothetical protein
VISHSSPYVKWPGAAPWFAMVLLAGLLGLVGIATMGAGAASEIGCAALSHAAGVRPPRGSDGGQPSLRYGHLGRENPHRHPRADRRGLEPL